VIFIHSRDLARSARAAPLADARGAQIVEFAVALPLLVVFVVGIFDFSGAFTLKQKLTNISRDAARLAAADPANDISRPNSTVPASVDDAYQAILRYFTTNNLDRCGITETSGATAPTWIFTSPSSSLPCGLTITINRGYYLPAGTATQTAPADCQPTGGTGLQVVATCVTIQYSYQWRFGKAASLLGSATTLPQNITATSIAMNEN
jgi:hypothetical protein